MPRNKRNSNYIQKAHDLGYVTGYKVYPKLPNKFGAMPSASLGFNKGMRDCKTAQKSKTKLTKYYSSNR